MVPTLSYLVFFSVGILICHKSTPMVTSDSYSGTISFQYPVEILSFDTEPQYKQTPDSIRTCTPPEVSAVHPSVTPPWGKMRGNLDKNES